MGIVTVATMKKSKRRLMEVTRIALVEAMAVVLNQLEKLKSEVIVVMMTAAVLVTKSNSQIKSQSDKELRFLILLMIVLIKNLTKITKKLYKNKLNLFHLE